MSGTNSPSSLAYLTASDDAYSNQPANLLAAGLSPFSDVNNQPVEQTIYSDGFSAQVFLDSSGDIIIAYQGTSALNPLTFTDDADILLRGTPQAYHDAVAFAQCVQSVVAQVYSGKALPKIYVTGHSLGGAEAEYVAYSAQTANLQIAGGATFGAPGIIGNTNSNPPANFTDYVNYGDPVGNFASDVSGEAGFAPSSGMAHVGTVKQVGTPANADNLALESLAFGTAGSISSLPITLLKYPLELSLVGTALLGNIFNHRLAASPGSSDANSYAASLGITSLLPANASQILPSPMSVLAGIDATQGASGSADFSQATAPSAATAQSPNFSVSVAGSEITVIQKVAIENGANYVSDPGTFTFNLNQPSGSTLEASFLDSSNGDNEQLFFSSTDGVEQKAITEFVNGSYDVTSFDYTTPSSAFTSTDYYPSLLLGNGDPTSQDVTADNGSSEVTTYSDNSSDTIYYTGSDGTGSVTNSQISIAYGESEEDSDDTPNEIITFSGNGTLIIDSPISFTGTIFNFVAGDTIDLGGISSQSAMIVGSSLEVQNYDGSSLSLQLDPSLNYSEDRLYIEEDGNGGSDIFIQNIAPTGSGNQTVTVDATGSDDNGNPVPYSATVSVTPDVLNFSPERTGNVIPQSIPITVTYESETVDPNEGPDIIAVTGAASDITSLYGLGPDNPTGTTQISLSDLGIGNPLLSVSYDGSTTSVTFDVDADVYQPAYADISTAGITNPLSYLYNVGLFHVGQTASLDVTIANTATASPQYGLNSLAAYLTDFLVTNPGTLGEFTAENGLTLGSGDVGTVAVTFDADVAGVATVDSSLFDPISHDPDLPDEAAQANDSFELSGVVYNYAQPTLIDANYGLVNGATAVTPLAAPTGGTLTQTDDTDWNLDFGTIYQSDPTDYLANILIANVAPTELYSDNLSGSFDVLGGSGFIDAIENQYPQVAVPQTILDIELGDFIPDLTNLGTHTLTILYHPTSIDDAGTTDLPDITLTVTDDIVACYLSGTRIATLYGETPVEDLAIGDMVQARNSGYAPIKWIGHRRIDCCRHVDPRKVWPVRIHAGAFAYAVPFRDLWLSPDHAVFVDGVLIPVKYLINGTSVAQIEAPEVTYYHIELEQHDVLLAEGLPSESLLPNGDRNAFENGGHALQLYPDFHSLAWDALGCAPLVVIGRELDAVCRHLNRRAAMIADAEEVLRVAA